MLPWLFLGCGPGPSPTVVATAPRPDGGIDADGDGEDSRASGGRDCDDADPDIRPGVAERCDGVDQDCDDVVDEGVEDTVWVDGDGDGYGAEGTERTGCGLEGVAEGGDCDDADEARNPGATERCNGVDDDCNARSPEVAVLGDVGYSSVAEALADAVDGDEITLCDGEHPTAGARVSADVTLRSASGDPARTVLVGDGVRSILEVGEAALTVRDLTLRGGRGTSAAALGGGRAGGAIHAVAVPGAVVTVEGCVVEGNRADYGGGVAATDLTVVSSLFRGNEAEQVGWGGGIYVPPGGSLVLTDARLVGNVAVFGGGLLDDGDLSATGTTLEANTAAVSGGGAYTKGHASLSGVTVTGNDATYGGGWYLDGGEVAADGATVFGGNAATARGGGLYLLGSADLVWVGGALRQNAASFGGGAYVDRVDTALPGSVTVSGLLVTGNEATLSPTSSGGGLYLRGSPIALADTVVEGNRSFWGGGTSLNESGAEPIRVRGVTWRDNDGTYGGATDLYLAEAELTDCVLEGNAADQGGGIYLDTATAVVLANVAFGDDPVDNLPEDVGVRQGGTDPLVAIDYDGPIDAACEAPGGCAP